MARFSRPEKRMPDTIESALKESLAKFVVPQTNRALGAHGTSFSIDSSNDRCKVSISCGFPVDRARDELLLALTEYLDSTGFDRPVEFDLSWAVKSHSVQPALKAFPNIGNIVAIASGKGGVGKSTVTANVALALAQEGARVGILDADVYGPSQPRILNLIGQRPETIDGKTLSPLSAFGVSVMSIGFLVEEGQAVAWRGPMVTSALNQMLSQTDWGELDYLFVDMPPGTGDIQLTLAQKVPVSGSVIVTTPPAIALSDARKGVDLFRKVSIPMLGIVENMSVHVCSQCGHEDAIFGADGGSRLAEEYDLPLLGSLPLTRKVGDQTDAGTPTVVADPDGAAARAFRATALRIAGELAATGRDYSHLFPNVTVEGTS
jgi:ATP-binding protein involved in chromosome partitioning